jgi:uridylate kinase
VYTADPKANPEAEFIPRISYLEVMTRELGVMDAAAVSL